MTTTSTIQQHASVILDQVAGYVGHRTIQVGLRHGLFGRIAGHPNGVAAADLASESGLDPFYLEVWCRAAVATGVLDASGPGVRVDPLTVSLLTDRDSAAYLGGLFPLLDQPEVFDLFADRLPTGQRTWWDEFGPDFIEGVASTCRPAYLRLVPGGLALVPGLEERLADGADVLDLACGTGAGLLQLAEYYPVARLAGVDGDAYSLGQAEAALRDAGMHERTSLHRSALEDLDHEAAFDMALINMSMHECRDLDRVTANVFRALRPGGYFVISDFPFPEDEAGLRSVPGRIMSGIQFVEAQIDDQLLPTRAFVDLLSRHGFESVDSFDITPTHAVTHGRVPGQTETRSVVPASPSGERS
jgi:SAM-dependent methyltransferase